MAVRFGLRGPLEVGEDVDAIAAEVVFHASPGRRETRPASFEFHGHAVHRNARCVAVNMHPPMSWNDKRGQPFVHVGRARGVGDSRHRLCDQTGLMGHDRFLPFSGRLFLLEWFDFNAE